MWRLLFPFRVDGFHFRKQVPIGPYVVDFACHHAKVVIEVDGDTHATAVGTARDARRDAFLRRAGYIALRFSNRDVVGSPEGVSIVVARTLADRQRSLRSARATSGLPGRKS